MTKSQLNNFTVAAINLVILIFLASFDYYSNTAFKCFILSLPSISFVASLRSALSDFVVKAKAPDTKVTSK